MTTTYRPTMSALAAEGIARRAVLTSRHGAWVVLLRALLRELERLRNLTGGALPEAQGERLGATSWLGGVLLHGSSFLEVRGRTLGSPHEARRYAAAVLAAAEVWQARELAEAEAEAVAQAAA